LGCELTKNIKYDLIFFVQMLDNLQDKVWVGAAAACGPMQNYN